MGLSLNSTGVAVRNRETGETWGVHDKCYTALVALAPEAFGLDGGFTTIGPTFDEIKCAFKDCEEKTP